MAGNKGIEKGSVSNVAFRTYMVVIALVVGFLAYFAGQQAGETETKYEAAQLDLEKQHNVYSQDLKVNKERPNSGTYSLWKSGMSNLLP